MRNIFYIIVTILLISISAKGQNFEPVLDINAFKKTYNEKASAIKSLKSAFVQEKSISLLEKKLISEGSFQFKTPDKLRIEYNKPYSYLFIMNKDKIIIKNDQKQTSISTKSNKIFKLVSQITMDCISGNVLSSKEFKISILENKSQYLINLIPNNNSLKDILKEIKIYIDKSDYNVDKLEMYEVSGDFTKMIFKNRQTNIPVADEIFMAN
jgi:outer membrane lipoprotein-sorting protein